MRGSITFITLSSNRWGKNERKHKLPNIKNKSDVTTNFICMKRILGIYYKQLLVDKFENLDEGKNSLSDTNNLEGIILREIGQKERDKYCMVSFLCGI